MMDLILFGIFPYVAVALAVAVGIYRYTIDRYSWSSQSSQFLEKKALFWGSVPWHYAILLILLAHFLAFLVPGAWDALLGAPLRLLLLEATGMALGICTLLALLLLIVRRAGNARLCVVTSRVDWLLLILLLLQVATGVIIATTLRWGGLWYAHTISPWLWSLLTLRPDIQYLAVMPAVVKLHAFNGFLLLAVFPFSRLVHVVSVPFTYLSRPYQVVVWHRRRARQG
ncbi:respiratory nitrate reductase subunit gamma [Geothermobacter hydrogeniphilus]|uniref:Respiratory nitrate reductase subunit gamma n=1 Tax=Geothermobacter hydrogeniphilus TaxID=1969733 RepID=A0A1X0XN16_9BACT|nr:respiratory nitrate reductase subunit gamma [Geothermobacter hydrogeniphilus]ORJ54286.1 respiratory nitrate reductase subunit gamma [Geothermobacter hydrogeniphilus]